MKIDTQHAHPSPNPSPSPQSQPSLGTADPATPPDANALSADLNRFSVRERKATSSDFSSEAPKIENTERQRILELVELCQHWTPENEPQPFHLSQSAFAAPVHPDVQAATGQESTGLAPDADKGAADSPAASPWTFEKWGDNLRNGLKKIISSGAGSASGQVFRDFLLASFKLHPVMRTLGIVLPSAVSMYLEQAISEELKARSVYRYDPHMQSRVAASMVNNFVRKSIEGKFPGLDTLALSVLRAIGIGAVGGGRSACEQLFDTVQELRKGGRDPHAPQKPVPAELLFVCLMAASVRGSTEIPIQTAKSLQKLVQAELQASSLALKAGSSHTFSDLVKVCLENQAQHQQWVNRMMQSKLLYPTFASATQQATSCRLISNSIRATSMPPAPQDPWGADGPYAPGGRYGDSF